jgi:hypothetical protein
MVFALQPNIGARASEIGRRATEMSHFPVAFDQRLTTIRGLYSLERLAVFEA